MKSSLKIFTKRSLLGISAILFLTVLFLIRPTNNNDLPAQLSVSRSYLAKITELREKTQKQVINRNANKDLVPLRNRPVSSDLEKVDLVQNAVLSFNQHSESIERNWKSYRIQVYENTGLSADELEELDRILLQYLEIIKDIQRETSRASADSDEYKVLFQAHEQVFSAMEDDVKSYLGEARFEYVKKSRTSFNKAFRDFSHSNTEIIGW